MRKQTNPPSMSGRVRKLCVDKLVLDLAVVAFSHILVDINVLTHNLNELPEIPCMPEVCSGLVWAAESP